MDESLYSSTMAKTLRYISVRPRSAKEVTDYLHKRTTDSQIIERIVKRLQEMNYLNDETFAQFVIDSYQGKKAKGRRFLEQLLKKHNISELTIKKVITLDEQQELTSARFLLQKKLPLWKTLSVEKRMRRIQSYLLSRGFSRSVIRSLVDEYGKSAYNTTTEINM